MRKSEASASFSSSSSSSSCQPAPTRDAHVPGPLQLPHAPPNASPPSLSSSAPPLLLLLFLLQSMLEEELGSSVVDPVKATERLHCEDRSSHCGHCAVAPLRPSKRPPTAPAASQRSPDGLGRTRAQKTLEQEEEEQQLQESPEQSPVRAQQGLSQNLDWVVHRPSKLFITRRRINNRRKRSPVPAQQGIQPNSPSYHLQQIVPDGLGCTRAQ